MKYCITCNQRLQGDPLEHIQCGSKAYSKEEILKIFTLAHGFQMRHDLYSLWENLAKVKDNPLAKTAQGQLWIDAISEELRRLEQLFS